MMPRDASSVSEREVAEPRIVMLATGTQPASLVLASHAELGRRIAAGGATHEIADERMSRDHARVTWQRDAWVISDLDSRNGTFVDGERITGETKRRGDVILRLGHTLFALLADGRGHPAPDRDPVIGPELARAYDEIRRHAAADALLIQGESGSGKELAARLFHQSGPRKRGPFVAVNCAAIPEGVAERLLFGAKKGAFSGAIEALGHFQMAAGGTLFLDEIAELDPNVQAKLLRVFETHEVVPIGATNGTPLDLAIVAASHRDLRVEVADRRLRDDLYHRIARVNVHLPPLRDRKVDIARLVQHEIARVHESLAAHAKLVETCCLRPWPGNVRELRAAVHRAATEALAANRQIVRIEDLALTAGMPLGASQPETSVERRPPTSPTELDKAAVMAALVRANGVVSVAARELGLHRTQLYRLMDKYGIARDE
jgi:transcriptional regulator with PAS, ATPase and Fis domain